MTLTSKISALVLAGGMVAALATPSLAGYVIVETGGDRCEAMEESAAEGSQHVGGPYETEEAAKAAMKGHSKCKNS